MPNRKVTPDILRGESIERNRSAGYSLRSQSALNKLYSVKSKNAFSTVYGLGKKAGITLKNICKNYRIRAAAAGICALVWCGLLYPELCFTQGTCEQILIVQGQEIVIEQLENTDILGASGDEIIVRSRFLEWLKEIKSKK